MKPSFIKVSLKLSSSKYQILFFGFFCSLIIQGCFQGKVNFSIENIPTSQQKDSTDTLNLLKLLDPKNKADLDRSGNWDHKSLTKSLQAFYRYDSKLLKKNRNHVQLTLKKDIEKFCNKNLKLLAPVPDSTKLSLQIKCSPWEEIKSLSTCSRLTRGSYILNFIHPEKFDELLKEPQLKPRGHISFPTTLIDSPEKYGTKLGEIISKGIDAKRRLIWQEIKKKQNSTLAIYPMEAALKDIARYQGACTISSGLDFIHSSIKSSTKTFEFNPYLKILE